jgi:hypothetical protein
MLAPHKKRDQTKRRAGHQNDHESDKCGIKRKHEKTIVADAMANVGKRIVTRKIPFGKCPT